MINARIKTQQAPAGRLRALQNLHFLANTFVTMQQHRHAADYDGETKWTRTDVIAKIQSVEDAFARWRAIRSEEHAQDFLLTLLVRERR